MKVKYPTKHLRAPSSCHLTARTTTTMATIRPMRPDDLLKFSSTNLDHLTETYNIGFYLEYLTKWPELCQVIEGIDGQIEGYSTRSSYRCGREASANTHAPSPRQTRILPLPLAHRTLRTHRSRPPATELPPLARPHHRADRSARRAPSRPRNRAFDGAGALLRRRRRLVRGSVCAREQRDC